MASRLASLSTQTIGVFLYDMGSDLTATVFQGIQDEADRLGLGLLVGVSDSSGKRDQRTLNYLIEARVEAIVLISSAIPGSELRQLSRVTPLVSATRRVAGVDSVVGDDVAGAKLVVDHLVSLGHQQIAMLAPAWRPSDRVTSFGNAMREAGLVPRVTDIAYGQNGAVAPAKALVQDRDRPSAVFAYNDIAGLAVLNAMCEANLQAPADLAVAGYDNIGLSATSLVAMTSVDQHAFRLGQLAIQAAQARIADPKAPPTLQTLPPELIIRRSTAGTAK
jgi:LacI family transcriptional regulator